LSKRTDIRKRRKEIEKWISDGIPKSEISRRLVCNPKTLSSILKEWEIDYKGKQGFFGSNSKKYVPAKNYLGTKKNIPSYKLKEKPFKCLKCNKGIYKNISKLCYECFTIENRRIKNIKKPNKDELFSLLKKESFSKVGEILGVSDNGVRKWCIEYGIPNKASFYKKFKK
jgi:hypothetical protein